MSWEALAWAAKQKVAHAADKLILLALADRHNPETNTAYPSIAWLAEFGSLDRKTVIAALGRLEAVKLIADSGERAGKTLQVKAYRLALGTVPKTERSQKRNSSVFSMKESQKRDTEPVKEPVSEAKASSPRKADPFPKPEGVDDQVWRDFLGNRKKKRLNNSPTAHKRLMDDLERLSDAQWTIPKLLEYAAAKGWGGIYDPRGEQMPAQRQNRDPPNFLEQYQAEQRSKAPVN